MLDESEFAEISRLYREAMRAAKRDDQPQHKTVVASLDARFEPVRREYERLTGFPNCPANRETTTASRCRSALGPARRRPA